MEGLLKHWEFLVGCVIGIICIALAVQSRRSKILRYTMWSSNLVRDWRSRLPLLDIRYDQEPIESLTVTRIPFWNAGSSVVDNDDIADGDKLGVVAKEGCEILDASVVLTNNKVNQFACDRDGNGAIATLGFDFVNPGDGALLQVIHTGRASEDLEVRGTVKGGRLASSGRITPLSPRTRVAMTLTLVGMCIGVIIIFILQCRQSSRVDRLYASVTHLHEQIEVHVGNVRTFTSLHKEIETKLHLAQTRAASHSPTKEEMDVMLELAELHGMAETNLSIAQALTQPYGELETRSRDLQSAIRTLHKRVFRVALTAIVIVFLLVFRILYSVWFSKRVPPREFQAAANIEL